MGHPRLPNSSDNRVSIEHLAHFIGHRRHEFYFCSSSVLPCPANKGLSKTWSGDPNRTTNYRDNPKGDHGEDQMVDPRETLAYELSGKLLSKQGKDPIDICLD